MKCACKNKRLLHPLSRNSGCRYLKLAGILSFAFLFLVSFSEKVVAQCPSGNYPVTICSGTAFTFIPPAASGTNYTWSAPTGSNFSGGAAGSGTDITGITGTLTNTGNNPTTATYTVTSSGSCTGTFDVVVTVNQIPDVASGGFTFSGSNSTVCSGNSGTFTFDALNGSFSSPYIITYEIRSGVTVVGTGSATIPSATEVNITVNDVPATPGTYTYALTSITSGTGCTRISGFGDATAQITVRPLPNNVSYTTGGFVGNSFCETGGQGTLTFDADNSNFNSGFIQYTDGTTIWSQTISSASATTFNVAVNPTSTTLYSLISITNENGCTETLADGFGDTTARITVNQLPTTPDAGTDQSNCNNGTFTLEGNNPSIGNGIWSVVSGTATITTPTSPSSTITDILAGSSATLRWTITNGACTLSDDVILTNNPLPTISVSTAAPAICIGSNTSFTASGATTYSWSPATGLSATTGATVIANPVTTTIYTVTGTDGNGCINTANVSLTVNALPTVASITGSSSVCESSTITLSNATAGGLWSSSNTSVATVNAGGVVTGVAAGTTNIIYTVTDGNGCVNSANKSITVNALPTATITPGGPTSFCIGGSVTLTASAGSSYLWSTGATTASITVNASGSYNVTVTNSNGCSATSASTSVTVNAIPVAEAGANRTIYNGQSTSIGAAAVSGSTYSWASSPSGFSSSSANPTVTPSTTTTYTVTETSSAGCQKSNSVTVTVTDNLVISKTITSTPTKPGDALVYQITYSNLNTSGSAVDVVITDLLPAQNYFTYSSSSPAGIFNNPARTITWTKNEIAELASLPAGATRTITITGIAGRLGSNFGYDASSYYLGIGSFLSPLQDINNTVTIQSTAMSSAVSNTKTTIVEQKCGSGMPASLTGYIKSASNSFIYYFVDITNTGNITDKFTLSTNLNLPGSEYVISATIQSLTGITITETPWLLPGESYSFVLLVSIGTGIQPEKINNSNLIATSFVCNTQTITPITTLTYGGQPPTGDNADMEVTKIANLNPATVGTNLVYTISAYNKNPQQARNISITDILPLNLTYVSAVSATAGVTVSYNAGTRTVTALKSRQNNSDPPIIVTITVTPTCGAVPSITNTATVNTSTAESDLTNNSSSVSTTVNSNITAPTASGTTICTGTSATLTASGASSGYSYKWYTALTGGTLLFTGNPYTTPVLSANTTYYVAVYNTSNATCESSRTAVTVTVLATPVITVQPTNQTICQGSTASFTVTATGTSLNYQWEISADGFSGWTSLSNDATYSGVTTNTLTISNAPLSLNGYYYRVAVRAGTCTSVYSNAALLTVNPNPTVNAGGAIPAICQGGTTISLGGSFGGGATSAIWSDAGAGGTFTNNSGSTPGTTTYTASLTAPATVTLTLTTSGGFCGTTSANKIITINPKPSPTTITHN
jgi:uncharacterized repeat protein (TIGR01451 family)